MADTDFSKMKVADLKRELKNRGLSVAGNKNELQERLQMALLDSDPVLEDSAISGDLDDDEVLNDEELENAKVLLEETSHDDSILASPSPSVESASMAIKFPDDASKVAEKAPARKIVLKRKMIVVPPPETVDNSSKSSTDALEPGEVAAEKSGDESVGESEKKVIKLSDMSAKERLDLRMKKFGAPQTADAKKLARAERFGGTASPSNGSSASIDVLKKRAERFGGSVSTAMSSIENEEKLKKRQERFGASKVAGKISVSPTVKSEYEAKAQQRLERFKETVK
uniref:SAP domain-containing protein n=1 Tax=Nyssomyia neivai TaxID=330878 RepID=A0A1L8DAR0_9DIPT